MLAKSADLANEGAGGDESLVLSENEEPATGPRAGFSGLSCCVHSNTKTRTRMLAGLRWNAEKSTPLRKTINPFLSHHPSTILSFGSFDLASIAITWFEHAVSSSFRFLETDLSVVIYVIEN